MNYIEIETDEWRKEESSLLERVLKRVLPAANPDLETLYKKTKFWWLEFDDEGHPQREIGFDNNRKPIVLGPVGENSGFLTDSSDDWLGYKEPSAKVAADFESIWGKLWPSFSCLEKNS
ncbi:hypothetical protein [Marinobacter mangrovi]|uniref:hypothetical protein n=1 Tax=Marinobacter mangrovi TaxID=2803918 RepID=UPI0019338701|nr:hypothetical protein [Marinobacter mangrovi]